MEKAEVGIGNMQSVGRNIFIQIRLLIGPNYIRSSLLVRVKREAFYWSELKERHPIGLS